MSAPAAAPPPAPAPPAGTPPAAPAAPAPIPTGATDPMLKSIFDDLGVVLETPPPSSAAPAPAATPGTPTAQPAPAGAPPAQPPVTPPDGTPAVGVPSGTPAPPPAPAAAPAAPQPGGVVVRKEKPISQTVEEAVRKAFSEAQPPSATPPPPAAQPPAPAPAAPQDDPYIAQLGPEEKEAIELAKWADANVTEFKGQGLPAKFVAFYKAVDEYVAAAKAKDPDGERTYDDDDKEFTRFVEEHRPAIEPAKWERLKTDRLVAQVEESTTKNVTEKLSAENEAIKRRQTILEVKPVIEGRLAKFQDNVGQLMIAEKDSIIATVAQTIGKDGVDKALEADPIFTPIVVAAYNQGQTVAAEFLAMTNGVKEFKPDNPVQDWLVRFIRRSGEVFAANGGDKRVRTGEDGTPKTFLPRGKFNELYARNPDEAASKHWTFSDEDVLNMIERNTKDHISALVKQENERLTKAGYVRPAPPAPAPVSGTANSPAPNGAPAAAAPAPQPVGSPRAGVSAAPGQGGGSVTPQQAMSDGELALLGIPKK
jgi:hypothetical protein